MVGVESTLLLVAVVDVASTEAIAAMSVPVCFRQLRPFLSLARLLAVHSRGNHRTTTPASRLPLGVLFPHSTVSLVYFLYIVGGTCARGGVGEGVEGFPVEFTKGCA